MVFSPGGGYSAQASKHPGLMRPIPQLIFLRALAQPAGKLDVVRSNSFEFGGTNVTLAFAHGFPSAEHRAVRCRDDDAGIVFC